MAMVAFPAPQCLMPEDTDFLVIFRALQSLMPEDTDFLVAFTVPQLECMLTARN